MQHIVNDSPAVVVTGVSSGIGRVIARDLVAAGYAVFGSVRKPEDADELSAELGNLFCPLVFDVRDKENVRQAAKIVQSKMKGRALRGLINNAGIAAFGPLELLDDEDFQTSINVNLIGVRHVTNAFLPLLRGSESEAPGKIINISSLSGIVNTPMNGAYCVSKHALESLADIYRRELLPAGIDVVSIRSGPIQSEIWNKSRAQEDAYDDAAYRKMAAKARRIMARAEKDALPASAITNTIIDILAGRKKRVAYHLSKGSWISLFLSVLPTRWADRLITRSLMS
jgi:NAD(P)-dependent dehydrogenase (short-subunit alcohol dehydrogenase family)